MTLYTLRSLLIIIAFLQITACSLSPVKTPLIYTYTLTAKNSTPATFAPRKNTQVLLIAPPTAVPGYQESNMIYTLRPYELKSFARNRWTAPPADMLATLLLENLSASGCFQAVVAPPFIGDPQLTLDTRLLSLQQEFLAKTNQVRMALQLTLLNNETHQVLANQHIEITVPVTENNPYAGVIAANTAANNLLNKARQIVCQQTKKISKEN